MKKVFIKKPSLHQVFGIAGNRPYRSLGPNISAQTIGSQQIFSCYGQGGKGWSTLSGSVEELLNLFYKANICKKKNITVIGAGCLGLTMATYLTLNKYQVCLIAENFYDIASYKAGANFALGLARERDLERAKTNYNFLRCIAEGDHQILKPEAVLKVNSYAHIKSVGSLLRLFKECSISSPETIILDTGAKFYYNYLSYQNYFIDVNIFLSNLRDYLLANNVPLIKRKITSFAEIESEVVINCAGLGAKELLADISVRPSPTYLLAFQDSSPLDYILKTNQVEPFYVYPKTGYTKSNGDKIAISGIIGGIKDLNENDQQFNFLKVKEILANFYGH
jgi:hypothetical protein